MAVCEITGKKWMKGNKISHSNIKTGKRFQANIQSKRIFDVESGRWIRVKLAMRTLKALNKRGL
jgi:large subunit ribosomal protein L28